jgi:hypothetical protein
MTRTIRQRKRKTPPLPLCPVHGVPMRVGHAGKRHQYRYCKVEGCNESLKSDRVYRLRNAMSLWLRGVVKETGEVILRPGL